MYDYTISGWTLVALVVLPFLFGMLFGMKYAYKQFLIKLVKDMDSKKLKQLINYDDEKEDRLDMNKVRG
jgi:hypothetical protein